MPCERTCSLSHKHFYFKGKTLTYYSKCGNTAAYHHIIVQSQSLSRQKQSHSNLFVYGKQTSDILTVKKESMKKLFIFWGSCFLTEEVVSLLRKLFPWLTLHRENNLHLIMKLNYHNFYQARNYSWFIRLH